MAKPDPAALEPTRYPFSCTIEPRFGDLDVNLHINNVAMAGILEHSRVLFHRASGYSTRLAGASSMVVSLAIEYLGQGALAPLTVHAGVRSIGRTSQRVEQLVVQEGAAIAFADTTLVTVGPEGPVPLPEDYRALIDEWMLPA